MRDLRKNRIFCIRGPIGSRFLALFSELNYLRDEAGLVEFGDSWWAVHCWMQKLFGIESGILQVSLLTSLISEWCFLDDWNHLNMIVDFCWKGCVFGWSEIFAMIAFVKFWSLIVVDFYSIKIKYCVCVKLSLKCLNTLVEIYIMF